MTKEKSFFFTQSDVKTLLVGICAPYNKIKDPAPYYEEFLNLVSTNGISTEHTFFMRLRTIDAGYFLSKGKLEEIRKLCEEHQFEQIVFSEPLSAQQERNLNELLECRIIDRTELILEIFEKAAHSAEGKTQVAMAAFKHRKARLAGKGKHMSQQMGAIGFRSGPGETAKEREARYIEDMILKMRRELERISQSRQTQRKRRLTNRIPQICLIGYTNAGKSTILNILTKSNVLAEDKLFATLDTTTRELYIDSKKKGVISDTVGFIQNLPHQLIEAFKATLSELQFADLLLQVVDISDPSWQLHIQVTNEILLDLEVDKPMLYVFNKADRLEQSELDDLPVHNYRPHAFVSALSKEGIEPLIEFLRNWEPQQNS